MKKIVTFVILLFLIASILGAEDKTDSLNTSSYTSIEQKDCITLDSDNIGLVQECEAFEDIGVKVLVGDTRKSIILTRNEREYDLEFLSMLKPLFSSFGSKLEWRHELINSKNIKGVIIPINMSDDIENLEKTTSYLIVTKITKDKICVVAKIAPQKDQNEIAREILDTNEDLPCLKQPNKSIKKK